MIIHQFNNDMEKLVAIIGYEYGFLGVTKEELEKIIRKITFSFFPSEFNPFIYYYDLLIKYYNLGVKDRNFCLKYEDFIKWK